MSDWDPHWSPPLSPPSASHDDAPSDASAASRDDSPPLMSETELKSLNQYIEEYLRLLGLDDLAHQFKEKAENAEKVKWEEGLPPVLFVQTWVDMSIKSAKFRHSYPRNDRDTAAIASLNVGVAAYLKYLEIDFDSFNAKASSHVVQGAV